MSLAVDNDTATESLADVLHRLGDISPTRIRMHPAPGTATEKDVAQIEAKEKRLFELVEGVLVEKGMGYRESLLAIAIAHAIRDWVLPRKLGVVSGEAGMMKLFAGLVRIPDVAYVSRERLPGGRVPKEPVPQLSPELVVEVLSESNTKREMDRKRDEYFDAGIRLVWIIDPEKRTAMVYSAREHCIILDESKSLDGGDVLPGFVLPLAGLFAELDQ